MLAFSLFKCVTIPHIMNIKKFRLALIILIIFFLGSYIGYKIGTYKVSLDWQNFHINAINKTPPTSTSNIDFSPMWDVLNKIEENYYDKSALDPQKLVNGAISGMVQSLGDPYTVYLPPVQNSSFKQTLAGQFSGIGAELGMKNNDIVVIAPLDGSPAEKSGIKAGDVINKVDNQPTTGWTLDQAVNKIRGPKGTQVLIGVIHKGETKEVDLSITRDIITVKSVEGWVKKIPDITGVKINGYSQDQIAYVRLSQFGDSTNQDWLSLINKLNQQIAGNPNFKGVVLDLRNNPGGYLTDAQFVASEFIKDGVIVREDSGNGEEQTLSVSRHGLLTDVPVVVLINRGTASAAEITAGALRDRRGAELIGENSFGKGIVQEADDLKELGTGAGLHITIAKWLTPNGTWVGNGKNGVGLKPDISVALDPKDPTHDTQLERAIEELLK